MDICKIIDNYSIFENLKCKVQSSKAFTDDNDIIYHLTSNKATISFGFRNKTLGLINTASKNPGNKDNILLKFINIAGSDEQKNAKKLSEFFQENGFLFRIPYSNNSDKYDEIKYSDVKQLVMRIKTTTELLQELHSDIINYDMILIHLLKLITAEPFTIETRFSTYRSYTHEITKLLDSYSGSKAYGSWENNDTEEKVNEDIHDISYFPIVYKKNDEEDYGLDTELNIALHIKDLTAPNPDKRIPDLFFDEINRLIESRRSGIGNSLLKKISQAYNSRHKCSGTTDRLLAFLYYFYRDIGIIQSYSADGLIFYDEDQTHREKFTDERKKELLDLAQNILKDEINYNLRGIRAEYDPITGVNSWKINTLLEAIYFSLSFMNPNLIILRRCCTCNDFFEVSSTNSRRHYCSKKCQNNRRTKRLTNNK